MNLKGDEILKKRKSIIKTSILGIFIFFTGTTLVSAATPLFPGSLINGVNNRYYTISTTSNTYTTTTQQAVYDWNNSVGSPSTITPIWFIKTTSYSASVVDFYGSNDGNTGYNGYTAFFTSQAQISPFLSNWKWASIHLNQYYMNGYSSGDRKGVAAHEFGHAMGLNDYNTNLYSIMCQMGSGRLVNVARKTDLDAINIKY